MLQICFMNRKRFSFFIKNCILLIHHASLCHFPGLLPGKLWTHFFFHRLSVWRDMALRSVIVRATPYRCFRFFKATICPASLKAAMALVGLLYIPSVGFPGVGGNRLILGIFHKYVRTASLHPFSFNLAARYFSITDLWYPLRKAPGQGMAWHGAYFLPWRFWGPPNQGLETQGKFFQGRHYTPSSAFGEACVSSSETFLIRKSMPWNWQ